MLIINIVVPFRILTHQHAGHDYNNLNLENTFKTGITDLNQTFISQGQCIPGVRPMLYHNLFLTYQVKYATAVPAGEHFSGYFYILYTKVLRVNYCPWDPSLSNISSLHTME